MAQLKYPVDFRYMRTLSAGGPLASSRFALRGLTWTRYSRRSRRLSLQSPKWPTVSYIKALKLPEGKFKNVSNTILRNNYIER